MFTGLIEKRGSVVANTHTAVGNRLVIAAEFESLRYKQVKVLQLMVFV